MSNRRLIAVAAACTVFCAVLAAVILVEPTSVTVPLDDLTEMVAPILAAAACGITAHRSQGRLRRGWALIGASAATWAAGEAAWSWFELVRHQSNPFPGLADVGFLAAVPVLLLGLVTLPVWPEGSGAKLRAIIDGLIIAGGLVLISWHTTLGAIVASPSDTAFAQMISLAYPISDVIVITVLGVMFTRARVGSRTSLLVLCLGLALMSVADSTFAYLQSTNSYGSGNVVDVGWVAGYLAVGIAALYSVGRPVVRTTRLSVSWRASFLPYLPLPLAVVFGINEAVSGGRVSSFTLIDAVAIFALVLLRQALAVHENVLLLRQLAAHESELHHRAEHDVLTDLANRAAFMRRVDEYLFPPVFGRLAAVMFVDLDDFKRINDSLGHAVGDDAIISVGRRLQACMRDGDLVARLGGDEFAIFLTDLPDVLHMVRIAERVIESLNEPFQTMSTRASVCGTIGIAVAEPGQDAGELLRRADIAMYAAKARGKGLFGIYENSLDVAMYQPLQRRAQLEAAVREQQFEVYYQPIVDTVTERGVGVEALLRWNHPTQGTLLPAEFLADLEAGGLMLEVGRWVLDSACAAASLIRLELGDDVFVSINVCSSQLQDAGFVAEVADALRRHRVPAENLVVELTESASIGESEQVATELGQLRDLGVRIAIDDFGTGYSSFTHLRRLRVDILKIDKSFVDDLLGGGSTAAIVEGMLAMSARLGLESVAEGVETEGQQRLLRSLGCTMAQGFLHARPVPLDQLLRDFAAVGEEDWRSAAV